MLRPFATLRSCLGLLLLGLAASAQAASGPPHAAILVPPNKHSSATSAQALHHKTLEAHRVKDAPTLDGRLDEGAWREAQVITDLVQKEPNEGAQPSEKTEIAILYDRNALYVGAHMYRKDPAAIRDLMTRRDDTQGAERIIISLDTFHNRRTAYSFAVTAAGVRADWFHPEDSENARDRSFDPVWEVKVSRDDTGWSCEMRIPFSQLRFSRDAQQTWGINFNRYLPDLNEDDFWIAVPKNAKGWASYFGTLTGLRGIRPGRHIEILPYLAGDAVYTTQGALNPANPFSRPLAPHGRAGLDVKVGLGSNFTLDASLNPDFGQVEADPAEVNLSDFETFFEEKRPFFVEGRELFSGDGPQYFYSRRIGGPPTGSPHAAYAQLPKATRIIGATKVTGRTEAGTSIGALLATSAREMAHTADPSGSLGPREEVEPLATFLVLRTEQEVGVEASTVGATFVGVQRKLPKSSPLRDTMASRAGSGGADFKLRLGGGRYEATGNAGGSIVEGSEVYLRDLQRSSVHYFQRSDQGHVQVDPHRTRLTGYTFGAGFERVKAEHWLWGGSLLATSPGFEINDTGFLNAADQIKLNLGMTRRQTKPQGPFHRWSSSLSTRAQWNFGGQLGRANMSFFAQATLTNFWNVFLFADLAAPTLNDRITRGGVSMRSAGSWDAGAGLTTDYSKRHFAKLFGYTAADGDGGRALGGDGQLRVQLGGRLRISFVPKVSWSRTTRQYVDDLAGGPEPTFGRRIVFAAGTFVSTRLPLRVELGLTPNLHLELWAELYAVTGRYDRYGQLEDPEQGRVRWYGETPGSLRREDGDVIVQDRGHSFLIADYDFRYSSLRSNVVLRWEWLPGSTLYVVWQQDRSFAGSVPRALRQGLGEGLSAPGQQVLAVKIAYWVGL